MYFSEKDKKHGMTVENKTSLEYWNNLPEKNNQGVAVDIWQR